MDGGAGTARGGGAGWGGGGFLVNHQDFVGD